MGLWTHDIYLVAKEVFMANKAVLVGVNKYKMSGSDLNGCVNDVTNVRDVLLKHLG